jgi:hypothetical protein
MFNDKVSKKNELNKFADQIKEKSILAKFPKEITFLQNEKFLYCDPPEVILLSKYNLIRY